MTTISATSASLGRPRWTRGALRALEWVANPALAGAAFCLLAIGVVTWLPAMSAAGHAMRAWRVDGDQRCFVGTVTAFGGYWRAMWRHALLSTAVAMVLAVNVVFLVGQPSPWALPLLAAQSGIGAAFVLYHLCLAAVAALDGTGETGREIGRWRRRALVLGFGSPARGLGLLVVAAVVPVASLPLVLGPVLFGPTIPLLLAISLAERVFREGGSSRLGR
jgi:uncharacterized membrane protein YesL